MGLVSGTLGYIVGTQTPWIAQCPVYKHPDADKIIAHRIRALRLKQNKLKKFVCICVLNTGQEIYAPKVKHIEIRNTEFGHCSLVTWVFEGIDIEQYVAIKKIRLVDDLGILVLEKPLTDNFLCLPGNVFTLTNIPI